MSELDISRILSDIRRISEASNHNSVIETSEKNDHGFVELMKQSIRSVNETQQTASTLAQNFELGDSSHSLAEVMITMQKANIAFTAMTQVRNKVVEAYREIMNMQV
jgi:flagellar hook-basal body complex protein FliE